MAYLFSTSACKRGGICHMWAPTLRRRYGEDLAEVVVDEAFVANLGLLDVDNPLRKAQFEYVVGCAWLHGDISNPPLPFVKAGTAIGAPCPRCGGRGHCLGCDDGIIWASEDFPL